MKSLVLTVLASLQLVALAGSGEARADTSLELLRGHTFHEDFNGDRTRTTLTIKTFQPWPYGTFFMYYDITGPFTDAGADRDDFGIVVMEDGGHVQRAGNEHNGFFGALSGTLSGRRIAEKVTGTTYANLGPLADVSLKYELEHVSRFGSLHYYGLQYDLAVPYFDFVSTYTVLRDDWNLPGMALQVGGAWQASFSLLRQDFVFAGFAAWGVTAEGQNQEGFRGNDFFLTQPQLLWDLGKVVQIASRHLYLGTEIQLSRNRYLIPGKNENVVQYMLKWNI
jgi:nucleoside-specific outer membrane channel protein Tsx